MKTGCTDGVTQGVNSDVKVRVESGDAGVRTGAAWVAERRRGHGRHLWSGLFRGSRHHRGRCGGMLELFLSIGTISLTTIRKCAMMRTGAEVTHENRD
jgi:hypothetical protein